MATNLYRMASAKYFEMVQHEVDHRPSYEKKTSLKYATSGELILSLDLTRNLSLF